MADPGASGGVRRFEICDRKSPVFAGETFGAAGAYERLTGRATCDLDPLHELNVGIVNLDKAPRNERGRVEYQVDICVLKPMALERGNGWLFFEVLNRGSKRSVHRINNAPASNVPGPREDAGNGFLMRQGYAIVWSAWQGDVPPGAGRMQAKLPVATEGGVPIVGPSRDEIIADAPGSVRDDFIMTISATRFVATLSYPAASLDPAAASLTVRQRERDRRATPPDLSWRFLDERRIEITRPAPGSGFDRGAIYEFIYPARDPIVMGIGFASIRDVVAFLRHAVVDDFGNPNPLAPSRRPAIRRAVGFGLSQSGRVIRDLVHHGFNRDLDNRPVFDAIVPVIAGSRRSFVNFPFAQPGRYSRQHEDHTYPGDQFPFTYPTLTDPISGRTDGILAQARHHGVCPKVMHIDTDSEIWSARASLVATNCSGADIEMPDDVRLYLAAALPHGSYNSPAAEVVQQPSNPLGYGALLRALLVALVDWVDQGIAPPSSRFPSRRCGTLLPLAEAREQFPKIPGVRYPAVLNRLRRMDYSVEPPIEGGEYPVFVAAVDADGNGTGGVRHPLLLAPIATLTGWNLRTAGYAEGELYSIAGTLIPFAASAVERRRSGDPRLSLEERYGSRDGWAHELRRITGALVLERLLLREDADRLVEAAEKSWDVFSVT